MDASALLLAQPPSVPGQPEYRSSSSNVLMASVVMPRRLKLIGPFAAAPRELVPDALRDGIQDVRV